MTSQPAIRERDKNGHLKAGIRLPGWDYCKPWFYMITLVVKRRRPILGEIRDGAFVPSPLGEAVARAWQNLGNVFPEVEPCPFAVMPEHFHGIIRVRERLNSPLGEVIRSFKIACTKANLALAAPFEIDGSTTFWFPGLYDTILFRKGQLRAMVRYVQRNAERRWAVMQNPSLFKVSRAIALSEVLPGAAPAPRDSARSALGTTDSARSALGTTDSARSALGTTDSARSALGTTDDARRALGTTIDAVGNAFLLESPNKMLIQVSRRASPIDIENKVNEALLFGARGGVVVSGCISPGEQAVARAVRDANHPLIVIVPRGFGPYFKPSGPYFDACAAGRLLMLSPFPQIGKGDRLTRERCFGINAVAAAICGEAPSTIRYCGSQPDSALGH